MTKYSYILISVTSLLFGFGIYFFGIFNPSVFILKVPGEGTPPADFDLVWGQYKINASYIDSTSLMNLSYCCVNITDKKAFWDIYDGEYDHYYIVNAEIKGVSTDDPDSKFLYPLLKITKWTKILKLIVWSYLEVLLILILLTTIHLAKILKRKNGSRKHVAR